MCGYFCNGYIDFILKDKNLLDYTNLFSKIFSVTKKAKMKKIYCVICGKDRKFKNLEILYIFEKPLVLYIFCSKCENADVKMFKEE